MSNSKVDKPWCAVFWGLARPPAWGTQATSLISHATPGSQLLSRAEVVQGLGLTLGPINLSCAQKLTGSLTGTQSNGSSWRLLGFVLLQPVGAE